MSSSLDNAFSRAFQGHKSNIGDKDTTGATFVPNMAATAIKNAVSQNKAGTSNAATGTMTVNEVKQQTTQRDQDLLNKIKQISTFQNAPVNDRSQVAEEFRILRTNIQTIKLPESKKSIMLTSCHHSEGKTTTAVNLALFMAKNLNKRVLLIDCDLRRPKIAKQLRIKPKVDIVDVIKGADIKEALIYSREQNLTVLLAKRQYSNASEIIEMDSFKDIVEMAHREFDFVIVDTCPVLCAADPNILGRHFGGAVLVIKSRQTQRETINSAAETLEESEIPILGVVLTFIKLILPKQLYRYQYYRGYYYYD